MNQFKEINGQLCRMVEPEPLKLDSRMPCAVRYRKIFVELLEFWTCPKMPFADHRMICNSIKNGVADTSHTNMFAYDSHEIIGYPVVEGSAEWALYQMMQGKMVKNHCQVWWIEEGKIHGRSINENTHKLGGYFCQYRDYNDWVKRDLYLIGWQLYEPEPKPCPICNGTGFVKYYDMDGITTQSCSCHHISEQPKQPFANVKVGDWVTDGVVVGHVAVINDGNVWVKTQDAQYHLSVEHLHKLDPSEVVIQIGCLRGVVRPLSTNSIHLWFHLVNNKDEVSATIRLTELDPQTRELVEKLLEAQEGK